MRSCAGGTARLFRAAGLAGSVRLLAGSAVFAQEPAAPAEPVGTWIGSAGAGLSLTSGNSDTVNWNVAFDVTRDPKTPNVIKWRLTC